MIADSSHDYRMVENRTSAERRVGRYNALVVSVAKNGNIMS
jgi:hypothetical protein